MQVHNTACVWMLAITNRRSYSHGQLINCPPDTFELLTHSPPPQVIQDPART